MKALSGILLTFLLFWVGGVLLVYQIFAPDLWHRGALVGIGAVCCCFAGYMAKRAKAPSRAR